MRSDACRFGWRAEAIEGEIRRLHCCGWLQWSAAGGGGGGGQWMAVQQYHMQLMQDGAADGYTVLWPGAVVEQQSGNRLATSRSPGAAKDATTGFPASGGWLVLFSAAGGCSQQPQVAWASQLA